MQHLYIPLKNKLDIKINTTTSKGSKAFLKYINKDSSYTIKCFLDAIINSCTEDAKAYISKNYVDKIDLIKIKNDFNNREETVSPFLVKANFLSVPKNCKADTMLIFNKEQNKSRFIHIYMLHEPDKFANWKIYGIEEEAL